MFLCLCASKVARSPLQKELIKDSIKESKEAQLDDFEQYYRGINSNLLLFTDRGLEQFMPTTRLWPEQEPTPDEIEIVTATPPHKRKRIWFVEDREPQQVKNTDRTLFKKNRGSEGGVALIIVTMAAMKSREERIMRDTLVSWDYAIAPIDICMGVRLKTSASRVCLLFLINRLTT